MLNPLKVQKHSSLSEECFLPNDKRTSGFGCRGYKHKLGILVAQLGTPEAPTKKALKKYLAQFLSDTRVIEVNRVLWWLILNLVILPTRPKRSAKLYKKIWLPEGSPLLVTIAEQTKLLREKLSECYKNIAVEFGMRYGEPSIEKAIISLKDQGCDRILLLPMYPQYAAATTASIYDETFNILKKLRYVPTLRVVEPYFDHSSYIAALATAVNSYLAKRVIPPEYLLLSYHGVPFSYIKKGDPYCCMCTETTRLLKPLINFPEERIIQTYQSRLGRAPWLEPYTDEKVKELAEKGVKEVAVYCPGFTTDCLETIDEIGNEAREEFVEHGGNNLELIPCLNTDKPWITSLVKLVEETAGSNWLNDQTSYSSKTFCPVLECLKNK
jgi:protoporphyrin/coproporphyrin ferrochelatase